MAQEYPDTTLLVSKMISLLETTITDLRYNKMGMTYKGPIRM